jgi:putative membrane protein
MIMRPRPSPFQLLVIMRGSIVPRIAPQIIGFALYAAVVVAAARHFGLESAGYGLAPFTVLGVALSIFLGFRNNAAYERWWEARKLWGQLVFEIRNFAREASGLIPADSGEVRPLLMESLAFCHYLRGALRKVDADPKCAASSPRRRTNLRRRPTSPTRCCAAWGAGWPRSKGPAA